MLVKLVKIIQTDTGYLLDPMPYLDQLPDIVRQLPGGAARFASDPDHYSFRATRCVKDLRVERMTVEEGGYGKLRLEIRLAPNKFKHDEALVILYDDVIAILVDVDEEPPEPVWPVTTRLGDVQLDEILPHLHGCTHEIKAIGGSIRVTCADLFATWGEEPPNSTEIVVSG